MSPDLKDLFDDAGGTPPRPPGWDADDVVRRGARIRTRRRVLAGAATLGVAAVVVGGSIALIGPGLGKGASIAPGDSASGPSATPSADVTPSDSPSTSPSDPPTPTLSSTSHACAGDEVTLKLGQGDGAAGTTYYPVLVKSKPSQGCTIVGAPVVYAIHDLGKTAVLIGPASNLVAADGGSVLVQGSAVASFLVGISASDNYDATVCLPVPARALRVTLPDSQYGEGPNGPAIDVPLPDGTTVCSGNVSALGNQLTVGPIVTGAAGQ